MRRIDVHTDPKTAKAMGLVRKRVQPRGSKLCHSCQDRRIAANKNECLECAQKAGRA